ncbi:MAG: response regulator transcription factor [Gemmatimonadota bacterium]
MSAVEVGMGLHVLVVEDEPRVAEFVQKGLREEGHTVDHAASGVDAVALIGVSTYDVIVLDVNLPGKSGFHVTSELRGEGVTTPILMLTVRDSREDMIHGLDLGADDYLTKPFNFAELLARVRALGRRRSDDLEDAVLRYADLELDRLRHEVRRGGEQVDVTKTEFNLLEALMRKAGQPVRRTELLDRVWGMSFDPGTSVIDTHISNLRKKLQQGGRSPLIETVRGVGYRIGRPPETDA